MNTDLCNIIRRIIAEQGESILADPRRLKGWISDYAKDEPKAERLAFGRCIEYGAYTELKITPAEGRAAVKERLAQKLHNEEGLDITICAGALDLLDAAVWGTVEQPQVSTDGSEWVRAAEQRETVREADEPPLDAASVVVPAANPFSYHGETVLPVLEPSPVIHAAPQEDYEEEYDKKRVEAAVLKLEIKETKSRLSAAIVLGIIALGVSIGSGLYRYNEIESRLYSQTYQYSSLESRHKTLQSDYDTLLKNWVISVKSIQIGSANTNGQWINRPGGKLNAPEIRFLKPVITYNSRINEAVTLYVKIIDPSGQLFRNSSVSPEGYTYSTSGTVYRGKDLSWDLRGWGNADKSSYYPGNWRIEVWYEGICLAAAAVTLN